CLALFVSVLLFSACCALTNILIFSVKNMLDLQELLVKPNGVTEEIQLQTILTSKLESFIHAYVITHNNEKSSKAFSTPPLPNYQQDLFLILDLPRTWCLTPTCLYLQIPPNKVYRRLFLKNVLYFPKLVINLLSVRCLVLEYYNVLFHKNSFSILRNNKLLITGHYECNFLCLNFLNNITKCQACALGEMTKASFKSKHQQAKRPFEELDLDLIGPISPVSREGDKYILTVVDSNTRYCSAIPINKKSDMFETLSTIIEYKSKRFGYHPLPLILEQHGQTVLREDYFHPIGNPVSFLNEPKKPGMKIYPKGSLGKLIGYNEELLSYQILAEDGRIVDTKSVQFLEFRPEELPLKIENEDEFKIIIEKESVLKYRQK
ncbi:hypothetical protein VP01_3298g1, partial [Puccinia sorghi]